MSEGGRLYAVVGRSESYPTVYHMDQTRERAERLRERRAAATGQPCFIVPMADWRADPGDALARAQAARRDTGRIM
jgi:hypothetical protein